MSPLSWKELKIVAVDALVGDTGAAVRLPIVRDPEGRCFALRDADAGEVTPNVLIPEDEVGERIASGAWIRVQEQTAERGHIVLLRSAHLTSVCEVGGASNGLPWLPASGGESAYVLRERARQWMAASADTLLDWCERRLRAFFRGGADKSTLTLIDTVLQQAIYVAEKRTQARHRLDVLTGVLLGEMAPERWPAVVRIISLQDPRFDASRLEQEIAQERKKLAPPAWAVADAKLRSCLPTTPSFWQDAA